jgi:DNA polymerase-3 subunit gamma/tau
MASYQSLYRRYRPQRFDEVLGQDHVTRALRNAVRDGRVGHAYLFSGPRGTGKTSTARILAKVLNCAAPVDGEPCGKCENCVAVADGRVVDWLLEQDAASKSKVDDMRDLLERVPLGTSGNRKVIILDEVHMLSQGAENALLKTLEEPPAHVVFVLATTDPQKVRPTIRSRTQHFAFRLLSPDVVDPLVRHIIDDAGLGLDDEVVEAVVEAVIRSGGGSARDTLSALDQVAALGGVVGESEPVDAVVDALCDHDPGAVLVAVADALASGREPRTLGENVIAALRDAFLSVMGAADDHLPPAARERAALVGERLGPAGLTRGLEVLGEALMELSRKPDPRIVVEVALVRLTQPAADRTLDALTERVDRLERQVAAGGGAIPAGGPRAAAGADQPGGGTGPVGGASAEGGAGADAVPAGSDAPGADAGPIAAPGSGPKRARRSSTGAGGGPGGTGAAAARDALSSARRSDTAAAPGPATPAPADGGTPASVGGGTRTSGKPTLGSVARNRRGVSGNTPAAQAAPVADAALDSEGSPAGRRRGTATLTAPASPEPGSEPEPAPRSDPDAQVIEAPGGSPSEAASADARPGASVPAGDPSSSPAAPDPAAVDAAWTGGVLAGLPVKIRSKWRSGRWIAAGTGPGEAVRFTVPNEWHQKACDEGRPDVERALSAHFGSPVTVAVVVDGDGPPSAGPSAGSVGGAGGGLRAEGPAPEPDEDVDLADLRDAHDVATSGVDMLLREFGGELVEEDP